MRDECISDFSFEYLPLEKKDMKRFVLIVLLASCVGCGVRNLDGVSDYERNGAWISPVVGQGNGGSSEVTYVVGVDYPDGYDWHSDPDKGTVRCSLVVFWDGSPMIRIPVGDEYEVSSDPDMHRLAGGNIFTDFVTDNETVIKKNGELLFRYPGRELIMDMLCVGDTVYTLGQIRNKDGFVFRQNGKVVLSREEGYAFEHLQLDSGKVCFAFYEPIRLAEGVSKRYFTVEDGVVDRLEPLYNVIDIRDVIFHDGKITYLGVLNQKNEPVVVTDGVPRVLMKSMYLTMKAGRLYDSSGSIWTECLFPVEGESIRYGLWKDTELVKMFPNGTSISSLCTDGKEMICILNSDKGSYALRDGASIWFPEKYFLMGRRSSAVVNGALTVGLSHKHGGRPIVWKEGHADTLNINGYVTAVGSVSE